MDCDGLQLHSLPLSFFLLTLGRLRDASLLVNLDFSLLQLREDIAALILRREIQHTTENGTLAVKMRGRPKRDEELASIDRGASCILHAGYRAVFDGPEGHGQHTAGIVTEGRYVNLLVQRRRVVDGSTALGYFAEGEKRRCLGVQGNVATLDHKPREVSVERCVIVCT